MSPALAGGFFTTAPPRRSRSRLLTAVSFVHRYVSVQFHFALHLAVDTCAFSLSSPLISNAVLDWIWELYKIIPLGNKNISGLWKQALNNYIQKKHSRKEAHF